MELEKMFSEKTTIDITVVKLNNQKLTKSIFNQLRWCFPFDAEMNFKSETLFGHVRVGEECIAIGSTKNGLFRFKLDYLKAIAVAGNMEGNFRRSNDYVDYAELLGVKSINSKFLSDTGDFDESNVVSVFTIKDVLTKEGQEKLIELSAKAKLIVRELYNRQILI